MNHVGGNGSQGEPCFQDRAPRRFASTINAWIFVIIVLIAPLTRAQSARVQEVAGVIGEVHYTGPLVFSPDGKLLALPSPEGGHLDLWSLETKTIRQIVDSPSIMDDARALNFVFSKDGRSLVVYYQDRGISLWDLEAKKERGFIPIGRPPYLCDLAFTDGDRQLVAILAGASEAAGARPGPPRWDASVVRWETATLKKRSTHTIDPLLQFKAIAPDGRFAAFRNETSQSVVDLATNQNVFTTEAGPIDEFLFSDDGSIFIVYNFRAITVWDVTSGKQFRRFESTTKRSMQPTSLSLSADKKSLAIGHFSQTFNVGLIDLESGKVLDTFAIAPETMICRSVRFVPRSRLLATNTYAEDRRDHEVNPLLRFWKLPEGW